MRRDIAAIPRTITAPRTIEVWAAWAGLEATTQVGALHAMPGRGREIFSFEYDPQWLQQPDCRSLDPALMLFSGPQYPASDRHNFGAFLDSCPDRWGRVLLKRREAQAAREEGRATRELRESDFLLGVYDGYRMGGLRFKAEPGGPFLDDNKAFAAPPWTSLRELEQASLKIEQPGSEQQEGYAQWLRLLLAPGGSLGGARPKAAVTDPAGQLWIAKFPSQRDESDIGAWESVAHTLATRAGIRTTEAMCRRFTSERHTFLTRRFDRNATGERVHFASAMTLLGRTDGDDYSTGASYLELAELLIQQGVRTEEDLHELWRRIAFSVCISNVDDHLRNHGFLLEPGGWALSPAYDLNPVPYGEGLKLNISEADNSQDLELMREVAPYFRMKPGRADEVLLEVVSAVRTWRTVAAGMGLGAREQEEMAGAFRVVGRAQ